MADERSEQSHPLQSHPLFDPAHDVVADTAALRGIAHPLRLRLLGLLRVHGPSTATKLAEQCGASSGLTSYHLRQLAEAGFVVDAEPDDLPPVEDAGGRQRWWKADSRSTFNSSRPQDDEEAQAVGDEYARAALAAVTANVNRWIAVSTSWTWSWLQTATFTDIPLRLTHDEATQLNEDIAAVLAQYRRHEPSDARTAEPDDTIIVTAQYQIFPAPEQEPPGNGGH